MKEMSNLESTPRKEVVYRFELVRYGINEDNEKVEKDRETHVVSFDPREEIETEGIAHKIENIEKFEKVAEIEHNTVNEGET